MGVNDEHHFEYALGFAVVRLWANLPREMQERLFNEATASDISGYDRVYRKLISGIDLSDVTSMFAMEELKATTEIPLVLRRTH